MAIDKVGTYTSPAETGFYYLNSRYYDPAIGRFINADAYVSTGQGILGNNMFAYCGNNPVCRFDPMGCAWQDVLWDWGNTIAGFINPISKFTGLGALVGAAIQGRWEDIKYDWDNGCLNPFNQSEEVALKAKVVSFYKGSTLVRQNTIGTCSILGTIWAETGIESIDLKHEYGHSVQERILGLFYLTNVAIPSAINTILH